jgi:hypothetical protein
MCTDSGRNPVRSCLLFRMPACWERVVFVAIPRTQKFGHSQPCLVTASILRAPDRNSLTAAPRARSRFLQPPFRDPHRAAR